MAGYPWPYDCVHPIAALAQPYKARYGHGEGLNTDGILDKGEALTQAMKQTPQLPLWGGLLSLPTLKQTPGRGPAAGGCALF